MNTITFPDGTKTQVAYNGQTTLRDNEMAYQYPGLFYIDPSGDGVFLTDDIEELERAQEIGFEFPESITSLF